MATTQYAETQTEKISPTTPISFIGKTGRLYILRSSTMLVHETFLSIMSLLGSIAAFSSHADRIVISAVARPKLDVDQSGCIDNKKSLSISKNRQVTLQRWGISSLFTCWWPRKQRRVSSEAIPISLNPYLSSLIQYRPIFPCLPYLNLVIFLLSVTLCIIT